SALCCCGTRGTRTMAAPAIPPAPPRARPRRAQADPRRARSSAPVLTRGLRGALQVGPSEIKTERTAGRHKPGSLVVLMNCWTASALGCACLFACANVRLADAKVYLLQNAILIFFCPPPDGRRRREQLG